jgi:hypothetical protein
LGKFSDENFGWGKSPWRFSGPRIPDVVGWGTITLDLGPFWCHSLRFFGGKSVSSGSFDCPPFGRVVATQSFNVTSGLWAFGRPPLGCRLGAFRIAVFVAPAWSLGWTSRSSLPLACALSSPCRRPFPSRDCPQVKRSFAAFRRRRVFPLAGSTKALSALTPSGFALGTPLLCSPPSGGDALVLQRGATPLSTGTDAGFVFMKC